MHTLKQGGLGQSFINVHNYHNWNIWPWTVSLHLLDQRLLACQLLLIIFRPRLTLAPLTFVSITPIVWVSLIFLGDFDVNLPLTATWTLSKWGFQVGWVSPTFGTSTTPTCAPSTRFEWNE
jgi:hypothetical protein